MKLLRKCLIVTHRYLGIGLSLLVIMWFASGIVMMYIDPEMSQVLATIHRLNRVERWLYNGLHSLDFAFWYDKRPLWDIGMLTLLLGGLTTSCLGLLMGIKRLARRPVPGVSAQPAESATRSKWNTVTPL